MRPHAVHSSALDRTDFLLLALAALLSGLVLLPLLIVAMVVASLVLALTPTKRMAQGVLALVGITVAFIAWHVGLDLRGVASGYVDVQVHYGQVLLVERRWSLASTVAYAHAVWPYTVFGGLVFTAPLGLVLSGVWKRNTEQTQLRLVSADDLTRERGKAAVQPVDGFAARGRLTALTALPKQGKTTAWFGLLKARQTGETWFGRAVLPGRTLVLTEEDRGTFASKVFKFGLRGADLLSIHAPEVRDSQFGLEAWAALVDEAARYAHAKHCDTLCVDTLTTWAPWAFRGPEAMSFALRTLKTACGRKGLAGVVILHNRKQQSEQGAIVDMLGTIAGSAAYDVVAGFKREKETGECTLVVDGRLGEWQCTARLVDNRYVPVDTSTSAVPDDLTSAPLPAHLRATLARLQSFGELSTDELLAQEGGSKAALLERLAELGKRGCVTRAGRGVKGDPVRWSAVLSPYPSGHLTPPMGKAAYAAYRRSEHWATVRRRALDLAGGVCQDCGQAPAVDVHHLHYDSLGAEEPTCLRALCVGCHRRRHTV